MSDASRSRLSDQEPSSTIRSASALGVAIVLVVVPLALMFGSLSLIDQVKLVGLPALAILGIMLLFGTLALVAMFFRQMGLTDASQPLALPEGSIRAAIALSLIVLFSIISIMLFQSTVGTPYVVSGLSEADLTSLVTRGQDRVLVVLKQPCVPVALDAGASEAIAAPRGGAAPDGGLPSACGEARYVAHLRPGSAPEATDLAKQLLILVGTLMTSVTSFYFASRAAISSAGTGPSGATLPETRAPVTSPAAAAVLAGAAATEANVDGCDVHVGTATPDYELPAARGGVATQGG
jgi:hypothetical protein